MANEKHIVVWDSRSEREGGYGQGSLVDEQEARVLKGLGAAVLPVDASLFDFSGVGGFAFRRWGTGWPLDAVARRACPLAIYCPARPGFLNWSARFVPADARVLEEIERGGRFEGEARFIGDTGQHALAQPPLAADSSLVRAAELRWLARGEWGMGAVADGRSRVGSSISTTGVHYGVALWGRMPGLSVQWFAATWSAS